MEPFAIFWIHHDLSGLAHTVHCVEVIRVQVLVATLAVIVLLPTVKFQCF